jgi:hypothetical protein
MADVATPALPSLLAAARRCAAAGDAAGAAEAFAVAVRCAPACLLCRTRKTLTHRNNSACPRSAAARLGLAGALRGDAGDAAALAAVEAHLLAALGGRRAAEARDARSRLALLYCQEGRDADAAAHMALLGARYRLARGVLRYPLLPDEGALGGCDVAHAEDGALPPSMLAHLRAALAPDAPFWAAHAYHAPATGYFSFVHPLQAAPSCAFEQVLAAVVARAVAWRPQLAGRATAVEWWAHCRPHASGHQLHFDSDDEGAGPRGPRHPLVSTVLFLSPDGRVGGPTLVTPQRRAPDAALAPAGWLLHPAGGRLGMFDGGVLHGVLPGRGPSPAPGGRRVTLMVALWDAIDTRPPPSDGAPGAARAFPQHGGGDVPPWAAALAGGAPRAEWAPAAAAAHAAACAAPAALTRVAPVWEDCDEGANAAAGAALAALPGIPHYGLCFQGF